LGLAREMHVRAAIKHLNKAGRTACEGRSSVPNLVVTTAAAPTLSTPLAHTFDDARLARQAEAGGVAAEGGRDAAAGSATG